MARIDQSPLKGFAARYRPWRPEEEAIAQALRATGQTLAEIGEALDRSPTSVDACLRRLGDRRSTPLKPKKAANRPCLCCGNPFVSQGAHNRLCDRCRRIGVSPYAI